jgi:hypothetical protein
MSAMDNLVLGKDFSGDDDGSATFAEGIVRSVTSKGITFTIPTYDDSTYVFGPAPYGRWSTGGTGPQTGDRCLILFPTGTTIDPWVIGWWPK